MTPRTLLLASLLALLVGLPAAAQPADICPEVCRDEPDCREGEICFPPTQTCRPPCEILCLVPDPVCGDDGVTYVCGELDAHCHGAEVVSQGPCDDACVCPHVYAPVCGVDGNSYGNACLARCAGVEVAHAGVCAESPCEDEIDCPAGQICFPPTDRCRPPCEIQCFVADPVCGDDGVTYVCGEVDAHCHGAEVVFDGPCEEPCVCPQVYAPVCGEDGQTYSNACLASCAGTGVVSDGPCPPSPCQGNADCPGEEICFPPTRQCQPACQIACLVPDPVCGADGVTYACGEVDAHCHGTTVVAQGPCGGCNDDGDCGIDETCLPGGSCQPCLCPLLFDPVCGVDGETYDNACRAACAGVEVASEGPCDQSCAADGDCPVGDICIERQCQGCVCPLFFDPVCGVDGRTYGNACEARCAHVEVASEGVCPTCVCPDVFDPVCGIDGKTYGNACEARCAGVPVRHEGPCGDPCRDDLDCSVGEVCRVGECAPCVCPDVFDPVCGVDGQTYGNACEARCAHVKVKHEGECVPPVCFEDSDGDGVFDLRDNCVDVPNPGQEDFDFPNDDDASLAGVQHYGNACDKDFDDDGIVGASDFFAVLRPCMGQDTSLVPKCAEADCNGDGLVAPDDFFGFFRPALGTKPGPGVTE